MREISSGSNHRSSVESSVLEALKRLEERPLIHSITGQVHRLTLRCLLIACSSTALLTRKETLTRGIQSLQSAISTRHKCCILAISRSRSSLLRMASHLQILANHCLRPSEVALQGSSFLKRSCKHLEMRMSTLGTLARFLARMWLRRVFISGKFLNIYASWKTQVSICDFLIYLGN